MSVLELRGVVAEYAARRFGLRGRAAAFRAVDGVDLSIGERETVGLVGESGSGKSTLGRIAVGLLRPAQGEVRFLGRPIHDLGESALRPLRARMGFVFQDPYASLNPRQRLENILSLPFRIHRRSGRAEVRRDVLHLLDRVGLRPADAFARKFPHQLSGGQRQRVAIARAIALRPALVVADEPISSLDVSVGAQILDLLGELQRDTGVSFLFISHDLTVVHAIAHRVAVMYRGQIVEEGRADKVLRHPAHPYTQLLLASTPALLDTRAAATESRAPRSTEGTGCRFQARCPYAMTGCGSALPGLVAVDSDATHRARCLLPDGGPAVAAWVEARASLARRIGAGDAEP
jgi:oligopeptide/dipeptide ABC transporter ATP-binding protein